MTEASLITDALRNLLNFEFGPVVYEIEKGMVRKFVNAFEDSNPQWQKTVPPTFPTALRLEELTRAVWTADCSATRVLNGGNELEYYQPINIGDVIYVTGKIVDLFERIGKLGKMLFVNTELTYKNQKGEMVIKGRNTYIKY